LTKENPLTKYSDGEQKPIANDVVFSLRMLMIKHGINQTQILQALTVIGKEG
jgi:hypothetical protein